MCHARSRRDYSLQRSVRLQLRISQWCQMYIPKMYLRKLDNSLPLGVGREQLWGREQDAEGHLMNKMDYKRANVSG